MRQVSSVNASIFEAGVDRGNDFYQLGIWADAVYNITSGRGHSFTPYVIGGVGVIRDDFHPDNRDGGRRHHYHRGRHRLAAALQGSAGTRRSPVCA
jgi:hypothetical protein